MRFAGLITALTVIGGTAAEYRRDQISEPTLNSTDATPKRFIIEFSKGSDHAALKNEISSRRGIKILRTFDSDVFSGLSVESNTDNVDTLNAISAVSQVWTSKKLTLESNPQTQGFVDDASAPAYSYHSMTGVDKLHAAGIYGKGAVVAVVDTGIAYDHPALGGGFGPGYKVVGGYDFVGNSTWPFGGDKQPDDDPYDQLGHGTHVAGTIAGKSDVFVGVAPEASLLAYKVFGTLDGTDDDTLIEAFLAAYAADADVITASIIGYGGWASNAWAVVASRLVERGIVITIAAGNWGTSGPFFYSNGASGDFVLGVASVDASPVPAPAFEATISLDGASNITKIAYRPGWKTFPSDVIDMPIVPLSGDLTLVDEACQPLAPTTRNFTDVIVLIRRGICEWSTQQLNLEAVGATHIMFYNNDQPLEPPFTWSNSYTTLIESKAGEAIISTVKAGGNVTGSFNLDPDNNYVNMYDSAGGKASDFTSWGGLYDLQLKPDIAAPGGNILSSYLGGGYEVMSGTSMATPYVAGIAALYIGQYGGKKVHGPGFAKDLAARIMSSGRAVPGTTLGGADTGFWASTAQVGNGLVDAAKVLQYTTSLSYAKFALNDTRHFSRYHEVDITNSGDKAVTYKFEVQDAAGFEIWQPYDPDVYFSPNIHYVGDFVAKKMVPDVRFPSGTFTVKPGQTKKAEFIFKYPEGLSNIPVYSGKILIRGSNGEVLSVPYLGVASNLKNDLGTQFISGFPNIWSGPGWPRPDLDQHSNFKFNLTEEAQDYPMIYAQYYWGVQELRWDIFEAGWKERQWNTYPPVAGQNGYIGSVAYFANSGENNGKWNFDPETDDANNTISFPLNYIYRTSRSVFTSEYWWLGKMANGSQIVPGNYTMRFAALMPFGTPQHSDNWDTVVHKFSVEPLL